MLLPFVSAALVISYMVGPYRNAAVAPAAVAPAAVAPAAVAHSSPAPMRRSSPGVYTERFYGTIGLKFKGDLVYAHIYDTERADSSPDRSQYGAHDYAPDERAFQSLGLQSAIESNSYLGVQHCAVDLIARSKDGNRRRINRIQFDYVRGVYVTSKGHDVFFRGRDTIAVNTSWLDPQRKTITMINIDFDEFGVEGPIGTNMLLFFPSGLTGKPVVEGFGYGADNSYSRNGWGWSFDQIDPNGLLTVKSEQTTKNSIRTTLLQWDGTYFVPRKSTFKHMNDY